MNAADAQEQLIYEISIRLPTATIKVPTYANYLGNLLHVSGMAVALTKEDIGILIPANANIAGLECYSDPDTIPHQLGCIAGWLLEFDAEGFVTRRRGVLSLSPADQDRLSALVLQALN